MLIQFLECIKCIKISTNERKREHEACMYHESIISPPSKPVAHIPFYSLHTVAPKLHELLILKHTKMGPHTKKGLGYFY